MFFNPTSVSTNALRPICVIGMSNGGRDALPHQLLDRIRSADILAGSRRQLRHFSDFTGTLIELTTQLIPTLLKLDQARTEGKEIVVLASGDPLYYGIGRVLKNVFLPDQLEVYSAPSAFQDAFEALGDAWEIEKAALFSAHNRSLAECIRSLKSRPVTAIMTDTLHTPRTLAAGLLATGTPENTLCAVCENPGRPDQAVIQLTLAACRRRQFSPLSIFALSTSSD